MTTVGVWLAVLLVGGVGAVARFELDRAVTRRAGGRFPTGTLVVNLSGATILGFIAAVGLPAYAVLILGTGLIGAYTTFSTWMLESSRLAEEGQWQRAAVNIVMSLVLGVLAAGIGGWIGAHL
ncbi:MAG: fluoride efflux transporter CrcB [Mycolicibacterium sp.]|nr:fluoride efflux transporter CrcB [Mycolicibacterium sp.]